MTAVGWGWGWLGSGRTAPSWPAATAGRSFATFVDNDVSAYSGKPRPQYAALMQAVAAGEVDVIVAWDPDRLHRSPAELEDFIAAVERAGVGVVTVQAGQWDLSTASGKLVARMLGSIARHESDQSPRG